MGPEEGPAKPHETWYLIMKKMKNDPEMLEEYDFKGGVRGKYAKSYAEGTNVAD